MHTGTHKSGYQGAHEHGLLSSIGCERLARVSGWDELQFKELIATHRSQVGHIWTTVLGLTAGTITIVGFAVDRESWGLAALAIVPELMILLIANRFQRAASVVLDAAASIEKVATGTPRVVEAHRSMLGIGDRGPRQILAPALLAIVTLHACAVVVAAVALDWTFGGVR
jgi:hypothetical protein